MVSDKAQKQHEALFVHNHQADSTVIFQAKTKQQNDQQHQKQTSQYQPDILNKVDFENDGMLERAKPNLEFQKQLMMARQVKKITQKQLAQQLNMQTTEISKFENGQLVPDNKMIAKIDKILGSRLPRSATTTCARAAIPRHRNPKIEKNP